MAQKPKSEQDHLSETREKLIVAALPHVVFDGWSDAVLNQAITDSAVDADLAKLAFPRGALDLALGFHFRGDAAMTRAFAALDLDKMRYSEKVAKAISLRLELAAQDKDAVRRGMTFFALPIHAAEGARAVWHTSDAIWNALGDTSTDVNWYTKRMTLSAVYSSCVLFWLGDESAGHDDTEAFIARRIENVMQFEKAKAGFRKSSLGKAFANGPGRFFANIKAPHTPDDLPGSLK
ncbi:MAG: COQ9 family protein [Rhodobacteraceae bacterium]|nr:COQ9 family protein [Paracoccaceae bacterium]